MSKKGRTSVLLLGSVVACLICIPLAFLAYGANLDRTALNNRMALLNATVTASPTALQARYRTARERILPILPPDPDYKLNPSGGIVVFDPVNFEAWAKVLEPAELHGVTVYPVTVTEDPETRYTAFYNGSAELIGYLAPEQDYFPFTWLADRHPEYYAENADPDALAWAEAIYDPARVSVTYYLLPAADVEAMAEAQLAAVKEPEFQMNMMMGEGLPEPVTNIVIFAIEKATNGIALGIGWPDDFTNKLEVFARSTIATSGWSVASSSLSTAGTNSLWWVDTSLTSNILTRFYRVGNADLDSDGDGLTDARESFIWGTNPTNDDSDADGFSDYQEIISLKTDPNNDDTTKPDINLVFPKDNEQWVWMP
jgi:hypothetical protein